MFHNVAMLEYRFESNSVTLELVSSGEGSLFIIKKDLIGKYNGI